MPAQPQRTRRTLPRLPGPTRAGVFSARPGVQPPHVYLADNAMKYASTISDGLAAPELIAFWIAIRDAADAALDGAG